MKKTLLFLSALLALGAETSGSPMTASASDRQADCTTPAALVLSAVHRLPDAVHASSDPDWLQVVEDTARRAVESGEWAARMQAHESRLRRWATDPELPPSPAPALKTTMTVKPTGFRLRVAEGGEETSGKTIEKTMAKTIEKSEFTLTREGNTRVLPAVFPAGALAGFSRLYLFIDATRPGELEFAGQLEKALAARSRGTIALRVVLTGGSPRHMAGVLSSPVFADQGANLTRRLGLKTSPALVRLTLESIAVFSPRLTAEGLPDRSIPAEATGLGEALTLETVGRRPPRSVSFEKGVQP